VAAIGGFFLPMMLAADAARAEKRVALIVGNSTYQTVPQLANPSRDASAVAKMFRDAGFAVDDVRYVDSLGFPATLAYRLVSYWLPLPAGLLAYGLYRRRYGGRPLASPSEHVDSLDSGPPGPAATDP